MSLVGCGFKVSAAAAFVVGLGLAGPQALGISNADTGDTNSASVSASPIKPKTGSGIASRPTHVPAGARSLKAGDGKAASNSSARAAAARPVGVKVPDLPHIDGSTAVAENGDSQPLAAVTQRNVGQAVISPRRAADATANPIGDFVDGVVLAIRRTFFNEAPTVDPVQITGQTRGVITGAVGAVDPESDPIEYTLNQAPTYGTLVLKSDGTYTYTPGAGFDGTDEFSVEAHDTGFHINLFNLFRPPSTQALVGIDQNFTPPPACTTACVTFTFDYGTGSDWWTPESRGALEAAANTLSAYLVVTAPVNVTYSVTAGTRVSNGDLDLTVLATGISSYYYDDSVFNDTVVQHKIVTGTDLNGESQDGSLWFNSEANWSFDGDVAQDEIDFQSVALHELMHSLGFFSTVRAPGENPSSGETRTVYDSFIVTSTGAHPISSEGAWIRDYDDNLTGHNFDGINDGELYFGGPDAVAAYGGLVPLFNPSEFEEGSSLSHLGKADDSLFGRSGPGSNLMGPASSYGLTNRLSPVELGILEDLGYAVLAGYTVVAL
jgi:hypothetical protein